MNFTTATIAEQRRNDMIATASRRHVTRTARRSTTGTTSDTSTARKPAGRLHSLFTARSASTAAPVAA